MRFLLPETVRRLHLWGQAGRARVAWVRRKAPQPGEITHPPAPPSPPNTRHASPAGAAAKKRALPLHICRMPRLARSVFAGGKGSVPSLLEGAKSEGKERSLRAT